MKIRNLIILLVVGTVTLIYRTTGVYYVLKSPAWEGMQGFIPSEISNGRLEVTAVTDRDISGNITPAHRAGIRKGDRILVYVNARGARVDIRSYNNYVSAVRGIRFGESWTLVVLRKDASGKEQELSLEVPPVYQDKVSAGARLLSWAAGIFLPLMAIATGFFIGLSKPEDHNAFYAALLFLCFSFVAGVRDTSFPDGLRLLCFHVQIVMGISLPYFFMRFFLFFPATNMIERKAPWLKHLVLVFVLIGTAGAEFYNYWFLNSFEKLETFKNTLHGAHLVFGYAPLSGIAIGFVALVLSTIKAETKNERRRMLILLAGTIIGLLPTIIFFIYVTQTQNTPSWWAIALVVLTLLCFPLSFVYVVLKHRVFGIRVILRRGLQYALISRGFRVVEAVLLFLILYFASKQLFVRYVPDAGPILLVSYTAVITGVVTSWLPKINKPVMSAIDRRFFREAYNAQQVLKDLSRAVRKLAAQPDQLLEMVSQKISDSLYPDQVAIFLREKETHFGALGLTTVAVRGKQDSTNYRCYQRTLRTGSPIDQPFRLSKDQDLVLPQNALLAQYLDRVTQEEPEALEVYLDNPKSWAHALAKVDQQALGQTREKEVLAELNTKLIVPLDAGDRMLGFISLGEKMSEEPYSKEDKELLLTVAEQTTIALDYAELIGQVAEQEKLKREIEIAKQVQAQLFPQTLPPMKSLDYIGLCQAARGVGGDYYDFLDHGRGRLGIALGDISGKGISAALLMASLQALLRSHAPHHGENVDLLIGEISRMLYASTAGGKYATFFYALYNDGSTSLTYVNAGHLPPLLFRPNRDAAAPKSPVESGPFMPFSFDTCQVIRLKTGGTVLGIFPDSEFRKETIPVMEGDILIVYSDGVSEALNQFEEEFGETRLAALIAANLHLSAIDLKDLVLQRLSEFVGEAPQHDDLTLVIVKFGS